MQTHRGWLSRSDQLAVAAALALALSALGAWWLIHGGAAGHLREIEQAPPQAARFVVDLNTAGAVELEQLPGIGAKLAQRIIETRETAGPYVRPADLQRVRGIGVKKTAQLRPYVRTDSDREGVIQAPALLPTPIGSAP